MQEMQGIYLFIICMLTIVIMLGSFAVMNSNLSITKDDISKLIFFSAMIFFACGVAYLISMQAFILSTAVGGVVFFLFFLILLFIGNKRR